MLLNYQKEKSENKISFDIIGLNEDNILKEINTQINQNMTLFFLFGNIKSLINNIDIKIKNLFLISFYIIVLILEGKTKSININRLSTLKEIQIEKFENFCYFNKSYIIKILLKMKKLKNFI